MCSMWQMTSELSSWKQHTLLALGVYGQGNQEQLAEWFLFRASHDVVVKLSVGAAVKGPTSRCTRGFVRPQVLLRGGYRLQSLARWAFMTWSLASPSERERKKEPVSCQSGSCTATVFYTLISEVTYHHICRVLLVTVLIQCGRELHPCIPSEYQVPGIMEPSWSLCTKVPNTVWQKVPELSSGGVLTPSLPLALGKRTSMHRGEILLRIMCILHVGEIIGPNNLKI